jgi:hypothetical protein
MSTTMRSRLRLLSMTLLLVSTRLLQLVNFQPIIAAAPQS